MKDFQTLLYYKYTRLTDPEDFAKQHLKFCKELGLLGRIIVSGEGINGTVSGLRESCEQYMQHLSGMPEFEGIEFKIDEVDEPSFDKIFVRAKSEIVNLGAEDLDPNESDVRHLTAEQFAAMKEQDGVVLLDVRNTVEHEMGKFKGALTLDMETFREFPEKLKEIDEYKDKTVIAYCTGGIRCEKATMIMKDYGFKDVYQIDGGIFKYARESGGKDFDGKMYVFDKRIGVEVNNVNPSVIMHCKVCGKAEERMVNCANVECNAHFALCESCGEKMEGCCSEDCRASARKRAYDGSGYYAKGQNRDSL